MNSHFQYETYVKAQSVNHSDSGWGEDNNDKLAVTFYPDGVVNFRRSVYVYSCWGSDYPSFTSEYIEIYTGTYQINQVGEDGINNVTLNLTSMTKQGSERVSGENSRNDTINQTSDNLKLFIQSRVNLNNRSILLEPTNSITTKEELVFKA